MGNKSLIVYASQTGNTEKVALSFKKVLDAMGWKCDAFKVTEDTDFSKLPFDYNDYDFLCVGTPNMFKKPTDEINRFLAPHLFSEDSPPDNADLKPKPVQPIKFGPDDKKGVVFATYSGIYLGPKEVEPVLSYMSVMMEWQLGFECVGKFSCPGKFTRHTGWYKGLERRPSDRDLRKAEIFIEETIEDSYVHGR